HSLHLRFATAQRLDHVGPFVLDTRKSFLTRFRAALISCIVVKYIGETARSNPTWPHPLVFRGARVIPSVSHNFVVFYEPINSCRDGCSRGFVFVEGEAEFFER